MIAPPNLLLVLAVGAGLSAANLYYNQPMLGLLARDFNASPGQIGLVPMLTQVGYGSGILLFAPLGDRFDRRRVIVVKAIALVGALIMVAVAPVLEVLLAGSLLVGVFSTIAQDFVPAAAAIATPETRGKVVGRVMTGLLGGILLSRVVSGWAGDRLGWRAMFFGAAGAIAALAVLCAAVLPRFPPTSDASYRSLLASIARLVGRLPALRRAMLAQALLSIAFSGFWSTLALALRAPPYELGASVAGAFGFVGAAGALGASLFGGLADRRGPESVIRVGCALVAAAFALMTAWQGSLVALVIGALLFDLGTAGALIGHQTIVYGLDPAARSRINAALVTSMFAGMATGAFLASHALARFGWTGVCVLGVLAALAALGVRFSGGSRT